jgi:DNA-binding GntR family transcriptional regulator
VQPEASLSIGDYAAHRTAHQHVREALRRAILKGSLAAGTHLVQAQLATQLQVSTTPVREALRDLAAEGLVEFDPHRGAIVHELNLQELLEIFEIRRVLEPLAIQKTVQVITDEELTIIQGIESEMAATKDAAAWTELNWRFHQILELSHSTSRLRNFLKNVQDASSLYVALSVATSPERMARGNEQHQRILQAVHARDAATASALVVEHNEDTLREILGTWGMDGGTQ